MTIAYNSISWICETLQNQCYSRIKQKQSILCVCFQAFPLRSLQHWKAFLILTWVTKLLPGFNPSSFSYIPLSFSQLSLFLQSFCKYPACPLSLRPLFLIGSMVLRWLVQSTLFLSYLHCQDYVQTQRLVFFSFSAHTQQTSSKYSQMFQQHFSEITYWTFKWMSFQFKTNWQNKCCCWVFFFKSVQ